MKVLCGHSVTSKYKSPQNCQKLTKNTKDIDHLVFSQSPFQQLGELKVLMLAPRALYMLLKGYTTTYPSLSSIFIAPHELYLIAFFTFSARVENVSLLSRVMTGHTGDLMSIKLNINSSLKHFCSQKQSGQLWQEAPFSWIKPQLYQESVINTQFVYTLVASKGIEMLELWRTHLVW